MPFMFEKLEVYQKAVTFADHAAELTQGFPRGYGFLADQLDRAALSIATNLAEGDDRCFRPPAGSRTQRRDARRRRRVCSGVPV